MLKTSRREKPCLKAKTFVSMRACILKTVCLIGEITVIITTEKIAGKESGSMKKIIAASKNHHKIREIGEITSKYGLETVSRDDAGVPDIEIEEDGSSFEENSFKKANEIMKITGEIAIADDSGLEVEYLGGAPGIYSARFAGEDANDAKNNEKLLGLLENLPYKERKAKFVSVITMVYPDGKKLVARGECHGHILPEPAGDSGFGYDPIFVPDGYQRTFAQLGREEKNKISHRAKALEKLAEMLNGERKNYEPGSWEG